MSPDKEPHCGPVKFDGATFAGYYLPGFAVNYLTMYIDHLRSHCKEESPLDDIAKAITDDMKTKCLSHEGVGIMIQLGDESQSPENGLPIVKVIGRVEQ